MEKVKNDFQKSERKWKKSEKEQGTYGAAGKAATSGGAGRLCSVKHN